MTTLKTRVWQRRRPRTPRADVVVTGERPLAQLLIYPSVTLLTRREGTSWRQYPIDPDGLVDVVGKVPQSSGLLPPGCIGAGRIAGRSFYWAYVPPGRRHLQFVDGRVFVIPVPPLVIGGWGEDYRIWALDVAGHPTGTAQALMVAPFPNCYENGAICWGTSDPRPAATASNLTAVLDLFLEGSRFNLHVASGKSRQFGQSVVARWAQLQDWKEEVYPLDDLVPAEAALGWALSGAPWRQVPARAHRERPVYAAQPALDFAAHEHEPWAAAERPAPRDWEDPDDLDLDGEGEDWDGE